MRAGICLHTRLNYRDTSLSTVFPLRYTLQLRLRVPHPSRVLCGKACPEPAEGVGILTSHLFLFPENRRI